MPIAKEIKIQPYKTFKRIFRRPTIIKLTEMGDKKFYKIGPKSSMICIIFSGIKLVNLYTHKCVKVIGKSENLRCVHVALCQSEETAGPSTVEETASENPSLQVWNFIANVTLKMLYFVNDSFHFKSLEYSTAWISHTVLLLVKSKSVVN